MLEIEISVMKFLDTVVHQEVCSMCVCDIKDSLIALGHKLDFSAI